MADTGKKIIEWIKRAVLVVLCLAVLYAVLTGQITFGNTDGTADGTVTPGNQAGSVAPSDSPDSSAGSVSTAYDEFGQAIPAGAESATDNGVTVYRGGYYYAKDTVALYIHTWGELPPNYLTKAEAEKLGWTGGSLEQVVPGGAIGGSYFGNYEGLLPKAKGRTWLECDINTLGKSARGAERILYSSDGLIYYTDDHYESFTQLY